MWFWAFIVNVEYVLTPFPIIFIINFEPVFVYWTNS